MNELIDGYSGISHAKPFSGIILSFHGGLHEMIEIDLPDLVLSKTSNKMVF
jgi:hypothetical protein